MILRGFTVYDIYKRNARLYGSATALVSGQKRLTFEELFQEVNALARGLAQKGISHGDRIGVIGLNHERFFHLFGAAAALGAILVPINWRLSVEEIQFILKDCAPSLLVVDQKHEPLARELAVSETSSFWANEIFCFDNSCENYSSLGQFIATNEFSPPNISGDDAFCIIYTAAVEGRPRGAVLSHENIVAGNMQTMATMGLGKDDAFLNMLPLFHITGLNLAMTVMHAGGKNVVMEKFDADSAMELTQTEKISVMGSFSPIMSRLLAALEKKNYDTGSLKHITGLEQAEAIESFQKKTGATFWPLYGQTETSGFVTLAPYSEKPGSAGRPGLLADLALVDENENPVPHGQAGEIVVRGPLVFKGYWNQEETNRKTFRNDWHHTGDMGKFDEEGYLWFAGRKPEKELIKPGGENVYPAEVEEVILENPAVAEVSVIGVPDPEFGEGIKAVCVIKKGQSLESKELIDFVARRIARYKKPRYVEFVGTLPKTAAGAIDRAKVKELYGQ